MNHVRRKSRGRVRERRGFVLLVTLVLLTLAALAMIAMSRASILRAETAGEARADLQRRWGTLSCQRFILPQCEYVLIQAESQNQKPLTTWRQRLVLGGLSFDLTFGDESAKANVATLIRRQGLAQAEDSIRRLSLGSPSAAGNVHLRLADTGPGPECFGDVFDCNSPQILFNHELGTAPVEVLTCWTDGRVNIARASEDVMREACAKVLDLTQIHLLADLQKSHPGITVGDALQQLKLTARQRNAAEAILTNSSTCSSLWVECRTPRRSYWSLFISRLHQSDGQGVRRYEW